MASVSVVPVGLSKFREGLYPLEPFTKEDAEENLDIIEKWQKIIYEKHGIHFVHASDELYMLAGRPLPEEERYDGYIQLENGVGMIRLMTSEVEEVLKTADDDGKEEELSMATGVLAYPYIKEYLERITGIYPGRKVHLYKIENHFFGERITVAGLITGTDLIDQLNGTWEKPSFVCGILCGKRRLPHRSAGTSEKSTLPRRALYLWLPSHTLRYGWRYKRRRVRFSRLAERRPRSCSLPRS